MNTNNKTTAAGNAATRTAALLAQLLRYTRYVLAGGSRREVAWRAVANLSSVVPVDRAVLVTIDGKKILASNVGNVPTRDRPFAIGVRSVAKLRRQSIEPHAFSSSDDPRVGEQKNAMQGSALCWVPLVMDAADEQGSGAAKPAAENGVSTTNMSINVPSKGGSDTNKPKKNPQKQKQKPTAEYALWLERWHGRQWTAQELDLLTRLSPYLNVALQKNDYSAGKRRWPWVLAILAIMAFCFPVREYALSDAYVVPKDPVVVAAPLSGVIAEVHARQGAVVVQGTKLVTYDRRIYDQQMIEAQQGVEVAKAELARLQAASFGDLDARAQIKAQMIEVNRLENQLQFLSDQLALAEVLSPVAGVLQMPDSASLVGRRLDVGERIATVAKPQRTRLTIQVPVRDAGLLEVGSELSLRLYSAPIKAYEAQVTAVGFAIETSEAGLAVVPVEACWGHLKTVDGAPDCSLTRLQTDDSDLYKQVTQIAPGQQGSAKIYADWTILGYQVFRKPIADLFGLLGL